MTPNAARNLSDNALHFVASDLELTAALLAASGADANGLRQMAARPEFATFMLDFLLEEDTRVLAFAEAAGVRPEDVMAARHVLGGPDGWN